MSPDVQQVIEVPVNRYKSSGLSFGNLVIVGGLGYVLFKTFLLEERVNDLTVLLKRRSLGDAVRPQIQTATPSNPVQHAENEYETSDDDDDDDHDEKDEVRIEEQPREVPPLADMSTRQVQVATPSTSSFVTTRQRRSGSELRRDSSTAGESK